MKEKTRRSGNPVNGSGISMNSKSRCLWKNSGSRGARCMECGVPFCQSGMMIAGMASGCPLHNLVPETNDLVFRGKWRQAYERLSKTHSFPEFTCRVCPALCEAACTCGLNGKPVAVKANEQAIIETAWAKGWVKPHVPSVRTGKRIAVVGSGPSGLAAAQELNRMGHTVTVFERSDRFGGLLRYGIPNMKLEKSIIDRRIRLMEEEGVVFRANADVGKDIRRRTCCGTTTGWSWPAAHPTQGYLCPGPGCGQYLLRGGLSEIRDKEPAGFRPER